MLGDRRSVSARSQAARSSKSLTRCTNVGSPARSARASPSMPSRSAPTATTVGAVRRVGGRVEQRLEVGAGPRDEDHEARGSGLGRGDRHGSVSLGLARRPRRRPGPASPAWRRGPRRCRRVTSCVCPGLDLQPLRVTRRRIRGLRQRLEAAALPEGGDQAADQAADAERGDRVHQDRAGERADVGHPARADRAAGQQREDAEQERRRACRRRSRAGRPPPSGTSGGGAAPASRRAPRRGAARR